MTIPRGFEHLQGKAAATSVLEGDGSDQAPTEAELAIPYAAPGGDPLLRCAVLYSADWKKFADGMAKHARSQALALARAGVPVRLQSISSEGMFLDAEVRPEVWRDVGHLVRVTTKEVAIAIRQAVFHNADFVRNLVVPAGGRLVDFEHEERIYKSTIVYTSLERDRIAEPLLDIFRRCGEIWVPCEQNAAVFRRGGIEPRVIPYPYEPGSPVCRVAAPYGSSLVPDGRRFYTIGKWEPRKNHFGLLKAFLLAFGPKDRASLTLKVHGWGRWDGYPSLEEAMELALADESIKARGWTAERANRRVLIVAEKVSDAEIVELHKRNNIYVSASHGEAWDIPAFDAKCAGNALVHVGFGGTADYSQPGDITVPSHMAPVHSVYGWEQSLWADYALPDLVAALQTVKVPTERVHPPDFNRRFSQHAVGEMMRRRVIELAAKLHQDLPGVLEEQSYG